MNIRFLHILISISSIFLVVACARPPEQAALELSNTPIEIPTLTETPRPTRLLLTATHTPLPTITQQPTNTPQPTKTLTPTPITWKSFRVVYSLEWGYIPGASKLWIPIPNESNGVGMRNVTIEGIQPEPDDLYQDVHGNLIAYWGDSFRQYQTYRITYTIDLSPIIIDINPDAIFVDDPYWGLTQQEYELYTKANETIPSDDERFIQLAQEIVGNETNPFYQAQLIQKYVHEYFEVNSDSSIEGTDPYPYSIVGSYELQCGGCSEYNGLFVTLLRTLGIPARNIAGNHSFSRDFSLFIGGNVKDETLGFHVWSEAYLPPYGWVQIDAITSLFHIIEEMKIVLSRGEAIELGHGYPFEPIPYFHNPYVDVPACYGWPESHTYGENISLSVEELP